MAFRFRFPRQLCFGLRLTGHLQQREQDHRYEHTR
jgi:hypothetical protein